VVCFFAVDFFAAVCLTVDFFALDAVRFDDELFAFTALCFAEDLTVVQRTRLRLLVRLRAAFEQRTGAGFGRVQPNSASARNAVGIASTGVGPSSTASTAASERSDRTSAMIFAGR
jgi:hypothetical protein